jgi:hypothetical protein
MAAGSAVSNSATALYCASKVLQGAEQLPALRVLHMQLLLCAQHCQIWMFTQQLHSFISKPLLQHQRSWGCYRTAVVLRHSCCTYPVEVHQSAHLWNCWRLWCAHDELRQLPCLLILSGVRNLADKSLQSAMRVRTAVSRARSTGHMQAPGMLLQMEASSHQDPATFTHLSMYVLLLLKPVSSTLLLMLLLTFGSAK